MINIKVIVLNNASIVVKDGKIMAVGTEDELMQQSWYQSSIFEQDYDMNGKTILPGFVDAHTHPVFDIHLDITI